MQAGNRPMHTDEELTLAGIRRVPAGNEFVHGAQDTKRTLVRWPLVQLIKQRWLPCRLQGLSPSNGAVLGSYRAWRRNRDGCLTRVTIQDGKVVLGGRLRIVCV